VLLAARGQTCTFKIAPARRGQGHKGATMNAAFLLIPFLLIRFLLPGLYNRQALARAAFFAPLAGAEKAAYWVYQLATLLLLVGPFFLTVQTGGGWFVPGLAVLALGAVLCAVSVVNFAKPTETGFHRNGLYRFSRNPMYVGYFFYFLGCVLLTRSLLLLAALVAFQVSAHWIILSEERWCAAQFGQQYTAYKAKVRRYF